MPIYAYRCESCGHSKDVLQKVSDAPLSTCPQCGAETFRKQVTAAGFQLKGSGWYVTDFRNNNSGGAAPAKKDSADGEKAAGTPAAPDNGKSTEATPKADAPAAAPAPASSTPTTSSGSS